METPKVDETFWHDRPAVSAVIQAHKDVAHAELVLDELILAAVESRVSYRELSSATGMAPSWLHTRANRARKLRPEDAASCRPLIHPAAALPAICRCDGDQQGSCMYPACQIDDPLTAALALQSVRDYYATVTPEQFREDASPYLGSGETP